MQNPTVELADRLFPRRKDSEDELEVRNIPPEKRRLHTETADLTVGSLHHLMASDKIQIPEFQRGYVWTRTQASRLIESLIIQCPIPVVYLSETNEGKLLVIDGNQRLMSIKLFLNDAFALQGLTTYPEINAFSWSQLDPRIRDHVQNRTIRTITILQDTHPQIKFDVFERLNTGSVKLNSQELRHGINHGILMDFLDDLGRDERWKRLSGIKNDKRMRGAELILRFIALRYDRDNYAKPLSAFLDGFSSSNRKPTDNQMHIWRTTFFESLDLIDHYFGRKAFKFLDANGTPTGNFNAAVYDCQMIAFSETQNANLRNKNLQDQDIQTGFGNLLQDGEFATSVQRATSDEAAVRTRIQKMKELVDSV